MAKFEEHLFGRIAVLNGFLTVEQLQECLEIQRSSSSDRPARIGQILLSRGYLTEEQLDQIADIRRKKLRKMMRDAEDVLRAERNFRRHLIAREIVDADTLAAAVLEQQRLHRLNIQAPIWEVLVSRGVLDVPAVLEALASQDLVRLVCDACDLCFSVESYESEARYSCPQCERELRVPHYLDFVVTDSTLRDGPDSDDEHDSEAAGLVEMS